MITKTTTVITSMNPIKIEVQEIPWTCSFCAKQFQTLEEIKYYTHPCGCTAEGHETCLPKSSSNRHASNITLGEK